MIEEFGPQPPHKWLTLPDMGYVIANGYNVVLVCLGIECWTFFPMTSSFSPNVAIYCIGFVNRNHWVQVNMKEGFPLPTSDSRLEEVSFSSSNILDDRICRTSTTLATTYAYITNAL
ncbi:unnamed protein product [Lathyrus sativus]|nr:unnamed protein product [Lathyrus sativus]